MRLFAITMFFIINCFTCNDSIYRPPNIPKDASYVKETGGYVLGKRNADRTKQVVIWDSKGNLFAESQIKEGIEVTTFYEKNGNIKYRTKGIYGDTNHKEIPIENNSQ